MLRYKNRLYIVNAILIAECVIFIIPSVFRNESVLVCCIILAITIGLTSYNVWAFLKARK
jgi:hypothetical protein